jgi:hypothetical protein
MENPKKPFSKRFGYRSQPKEITVWEDAPESLRHFVLNTARELGYRPHGLRETICVILHVRPDPGIGANIRTYGVRSKATFMDANGSSFTTWLNISMRV